MNISTNPGVYFIESGTLRKAAVETIVNGFISSVGKVLKKNNFKPSYNINVVEVHGTPVYSYAYIESRDAVNVFQGLNVDGSKRIKLEKDMTCKFHKLRGDIKKNMEKELSSLYRSYFDNMWDEKFDPKNMKPSKPFSWADYQEEEDDIKASYEPKSKKIQLPSLMKDSYQHEKYPKVELKLAMKKPFIGDILGCSGAGKNITCSDIRDVFKIYDTRGNYQLNLLSGERDYYPIVTNKGDGTFMVEFDPRSDDASYAIHMQRKTIIKGQEILFYSC